MTNYIGGGLLHRRNMMKSAQPIELMTFETVANAVFYNRYNQTNSPYYCDIHDNHIDFNTTKQSSGIWYWSGNVSAYNTNNKNWLFVPNGTEVKMEVDFNSINSFSNLRIVLKDADSTANPDWGWLVCSCGNVTGANKGIVTNTKTATKDTYLYVSIVCCPQNQQRSIDVKIYLNGVRVV